MDSGHFAGRYNMETEGDKKFGFYKYRCFYYNDASEKLHILQKCVLKIIGLMGKCRVRENHSKPKEHGNRSIKKATAIPMVVIVELCLYGICVLYPHRLILHSIKPWVSFRLQDVSP